MNPNDANALHLLGQVLLRADETERALEVLERAALVAPESELVGATLERARKRSGGDAGSY